MLNDKARAIYDYLVRYAEERGFPPTIREVGEEFGINSTNGVRHHLTQLERAGYIRRDKRISRGLELLKPRSGAGVLRTVGAATVADAAAGAERGIPIMGRVAAGRPFQVDDSEIEGHLTLDEMFPAREGVFALRIKGESMKERGILDGDLVVVRSQDHAREGDAVVALVGDDATVKTYRRTEEGVDLVPENADFQTLHVGPHDDFRVLGVVVGLVRPMGVLRRT
jgi:repressor LexA